MPKPKTKPQTLNLDDEEYIRRAIAAWFRGGGFDQPSRDRSTVQKYSGKFYVALRNARGLMAVYRIRNDGILKGLKRWPEKIES